MAHNSNYTETKNAPDAAERSPIKHHGNSPYVVKKTEEARETLKKFPVPEKYWK